MTKHFTHLHLHTEYSLLDGAIALDKLIAQAKAMNFRSLAITDHGNVFGAVKFFQKCRSANIKPILGMEAYITEDITIKQAENKYYHTVILVQNKEGYRNLCKLIALSYQEGFYFKPRIDYAMLAKHNAGLMVTSGCLGGHIPKLLLAEQEEAVATQINWLLDIFGKERFFLEVQPYDLPAQKTLNEKIFALQDRYCLTTIATGDCHYLTPDDRFAHEIMLAIQTHDRLDNPDRYTFGECRVHMRSTQEMLELFPGREDAIWNTGVIADQCEFDFETDKLFFPECAIPQNHTQESFFRHLCVQGLAALKQAHRIPDNQYSLYDQRLNTEIELIISMGFIGYFLVVSDFTRWAKNNTIPVGPGRGSVAGSLVAWALDITNIDPIKYNLLFERFLNPERISMPDIDIDFCIEGRDRVIQYIRNKYGHDKVCHIITFGTMMAKGVIKDVARVLGLTFEDSNMITSLIPDQLKITLHEALAQEPTLQALIDNNAKAKEIFDIAFRLEGLTRHASKHAAGIVISPQPIDEVLPVYVPPKSSELVAQYAMTELEKLGFLKMDLLGLKNLTLIVRTLAAITHNHGITIDIDTIPLDDPVTFDLICKGRTSGVFQLESDGLKDVLRRLSPDKFEDIIAVNALYRPGPLGSGMVDDYIERRHGRQKVSYLFPELAPVLEETYGVIVYQEQVMKIASTIAGYSLGESDILRRAMGKKKAEVMEEQGKLFVQRAQERNFDGAKARELFDLMAYFAGYGFNKSHSAAYALIAYQTAYLKANYTAEFMASLISLEVRDPEKMQFYLQEAKEFSIPLLPPEINTSHIDFSVIGGALLFGLQGIKNIGLMALENIIFQRTQHGPFIDILDFCKRVDLRTVNKRVIENLVCAGAFDKLPGNRAQKFEEVGTLIEQAAAHKKSVSTGQMGLFGLSESSSASHSSPIFSPRADWSNKEKLEKEKEVMSFYVSAHPLDSYDQYTSFLALESFATIAHKVDTPSFPATDIVVLGHGFLKQRKDIITKKQDRMCFIHLEDKITTAEIVIFPQLFSRVSAWLDHYQAFVVKGVLDTTTKGQCKIKAQSLVPIELIFSEWPDITSATISLNMCAESLLDTIKNTLLPGKIPLLVQFHDNNRQVVVHATQKIAVVHERLVALKHEHGVTITINL
jgi:DNA polymerase III subunit alpha